MSNKITAVIYCIYKYKHLCGRGEQVFYPAMRWNIAIKNGDLAEIIEHSLWYKHTNRSWFTNHHSMWILNKFSAKATNELASSSLILFAWCWTRFGKYETTHSLLHTSNSIETVFVWSNPWLHISVATVCVT